MGKNGTQLLRHCVRILVLVSTDLLAVRMSGIGKTVKEKVCVHTSRDIRAIASQLVNVWVEVFRKEKAGGGLKLLKQSSTVGSMKSKPVSGKPPLRLHGRPDPSSGSDFPPSTNSKRLSIKPVKSETRTDLKSETKLSQPQDSVAKEDNRGKEDHEVIMSEEEQAALAAAEAAEAATRAAAEQEKLQREALKAEAAELKKLEKEKYKWGKGKFALKSIVAEIDTKVVELGSVAGQLITRFSEKGLTYRITSNPLERSIVWSMVFPDEISQLSSSCTISYILFIFEAEEFCNLVTSEALMEHVCTVQRRYPTHTICYLTYRLMSFINKRKKYPTMRSLLNVYMDPDKSTGGGTLLITARTLETMIRLSTAHAKLMQRRELDQQEQQQQQRLCARVQRQQLRLAGLLKN